jgi:hypothetical protein
MVTACTVAKLANKYAIQYKGSLITDANCDTIRDEVALKLSVLPSTVRVFCFNPQSQNTTDPTAWNLNAKSTGITTLFESVISRPELFGSPGRNIPGCPSQSSSAQRKSATTGVTTYYGVGQVKDSTDCTLQQVLKIAVVVA